MKKIDFETARKCPKCETPGETVSTKPVERGGTLHVLKCPNKLCRWYEETWLVQTLRDGTVPVRGVEDKDYPELSDGLKQRGRDILKNLEEEGEVRNPFSR